MIKETCLYQKKDHFMLSLLLIFYLRGGLLAHFPGYEEFTYIWEKGPLFVHEGKKSAFLN